jgi:hypothetical protein
MFYSSATASERGARVGNRCLGSFIRVAGTTRTVCDTTSGGIQIKFLPGICPQRHNLWASIASVGYSIISSLLCSEYLFKSCFDMSMILRSSLASVQVVRP